MTFYGVGIDMCEIERFENIKNDTHFIERVFGEDEILEFQKREFPKQTVCAHFCVKEAFSKAIGTGITGFSLLKDVQTLHKENGKPYISLSGQAKKNAEELKLSFEVSITHTDKYSAAVVIALRGD